MRTGSLRRVVSVGGLAVGVVTLACGSQDVVGPSAKPPVVTSIMPAAGVPNGLNTVTILGTGFNSQMTVAFDGQFAEVSGLDPVRTSTSFAVYAPRHAVGSVDVVVTNPDGQTRRIPAGYTYAPADTFDFNGVWKGFVWGSDAVLSFTIENNVVVRVTCGAVSNYTFSPPPVVSGGSFSVRTGDGRMTGQILSPTEAAGEIEIPGCLATEGWTAAK